MTNTEKAASVLTSNDVQRAVRRIAHEIIEHVASVAGSAGSSEKVAIMGLQHGGVWLAEAIHSNIVEIQPDTPIVLGSIDVSMYRDDIGLRPTLEVATSHVPCSLDGVLVVLVDDVLFTGRTVRAALDALIEFGRPRAVRLAVMVDRGHRELPIRPDFVGKNLPTHVSDEVLVQLSGVEVFPGAHA
jgi:pyrimidine operon attenuation protein/uracil phosphoribosyltransferase